MSITVTTEKQFESDIEAFLISDEGGYIKGSGTYSPKLGLYPDKLISFIKRTQPREWAAFERQNDIDPVRKFCVAFNNACDMDGVLHVLRNGFKHRGTTFKVCYFKPESALNDTAGIQYAENEVECYRQWYYSADTKKSVDMVLVVNGIPVFAFELKNQYTGQNVDNAKTQWMYDRDPREICFQFNKRILAYFCVDHTEVWMTTKLAGKDTYFLPFNQGSNGAGADGGAGNPPNPDGYPTAYLWENVFQKDSMLDIIQKFINLQKKKTLIFPRYHQLDVVRKLIADVRINGAGKNYLIQHSAGSGKSNSIAWTAYRLASLFNENNKPVFSSVIVVTDRTVLDAQLQETISGFDHKLGAIETIGEDKNSQDLKNAINDGVRIIVTTLQKFPVIYTEVDKANGRCFAVIVDEAHSLDEVIAKINEKFKGNFTEGDKVILSALRDKLLSDKKLKRMAQSSDPQIFVESIFPKAFGTAAQDGYMEAQESYQSLFEDTAKYNAIMSALAEVVYREMRKKDIKALYESGAYTYEMPQNLSMVAEEPTPYGDRKK